VKRFEKIDTGKVATACLVACIVALSVILVAYLVSYALTGRA
jgi:hypothetical protein